MKKTKRKLVLHHEILRTLRPVELEPARGGIGTEETKNIQACLHADVATNGG
jgi:hypothetical protein